MTSETEKLFGELDNYDWDSDKEFQVISLSMITIRANN